MKYLLFSLTLLLLSCGQRKGCLNQFSSNYDHEALVDCCCDFNVALIIKDLVGDHIVKELCSGNSEEYQIMVSKDETNTEGILIKNFNNQGHEIGAVWNATEFRLEKNWKVDGCDVSVTGSLHKNNGKLHIIYAAIPPSTCENYSSKTCEARGL